MPVDDLAGAGQEILGLGGDFDFPQDYDLGGGGVPINLEDDTVPTVTGATDIDFGHGLVVSDDGGGHATVDVDESELDFLTQPEADALYDALGAATQALSDANDYTDLHITDTSAAHAASAVSADSTTLSGVGTNVQAVLEELDNLLDDHSARHENGSADEISIAGLDGISVELAAHLADTGDAHDASAISIVDAANDFTATDVEGALAELQSDAEADDAALAAHLADTSDAHDASATSVVPFGSIIATNVQDALIELSNEHPAVAVEDDDTSIDPVELITFNAGFDVGQPVAGHASVNLDMKELVAADFLTQPSVRAWGAEATGTGAVAANFPAGHVLNDILLLFVQSSNQAVTAPVGYAQIGPQHGIGTAVAAGSTRLAAFWKRDGGSEAAPTVADTGDHTYVVMAAVKDCITNGDPFLFLGSKRKTAASTTAGPGVVAPGIVDAGLLLTAFAHGVDNASGQASSSTADSSEEFDDGTTDGTGGGIAVFSQVVSNARLSYGNVSATWANSTVDVSLTFLMLPVDTRILSDSARPTEVQTFLTPGTDTWTKPTGARAVEVIAIGGGGAGGAGRSAATAAGGAGGGGGAYARKLFRASELSATATVVVGSGGVGGATASAGSASSVTDGVNVITSAGFGVIGAAAASADGGRGGAGGSGGSLTAIGSGNNGSGSAGASQGTTTDGAAGTLGDLGGAGGGGGNVAAGGGGVGGTSVYGGGGGGGGTVSLAGGAGGVGGNGGAGGISKGGSATPTGVFTAGGSGGAGGSDSPTAGGNGAQPGGGGGGGGNATQSGGNGGDGAVTILTYF